MKHIASLVAVLLIAKTAITQTNKFPATGAAGIGTTTPNTSSLLEIRSTTKGFLMSRMTLMQRNAIASPATGLLIYQTNNTPGFYYYTGSVWKAVTPAAGTSGGWSLTGNAGTTSANYLGTSDNENFVLKTNNKARVTIDGSGNVGIGTSAPGSLLEVHNGALTVSHSSGSANLIISANTDAVGNANQIVFQDKAITKWALGGGNIGSAGLNDFSLYNYVVGANSLTVSASTNNVGIGTTSPTNKLHVSTGSSGAVPYGPAGLVVESASHSYINLLAPDAYETGILFGKPQLNTSGGIIYNESGTPNGFQFRTGGNVTQMVLTSAGHVGIGTTDPGDYPLQIRGVHGLDLQDETSSQDWELQTNASNGSLSLYFTGSFKGAFDPNSGAYTNVSDERLKTNIKPMGSMLEKIMQLKPSTYQFKSDSTKKEQNGFIAQDVLKIFPDLVMHTQTNAPHKGDIYTLNYSGFGVIAIKGIQELSPQIQQQKEDIANLEQRINKLESSLASLTITNATATVIPANDALQQNAPNPFAGNTSIGYNLPANFKHATVVIIDNNGKVLKSINISGNKKGVVKLNAANLAAGTYQYSLYVDEKLMDTKQMVLTK